MITRIQVDGFKTLQNVDIPLRPFQVFAGANNVGKSNLFDVIKLLSMLPDHDLPEILQSLRGDPYEVFTQLPDGSFVNKMNIVVDILLDPTFEDEFEGTVKLNHNRLRYEIEIAREESNSKGRVVVSGEQLYTIPTSENIPWQSSEAFQRTYIQPFLPDKDVKYISVKGDAETTIHHDPVKRGRPRTMRSGSRQSVLSVIRDAHDFPHISAVRGELQRWKQIHLDPEVMREPNAVDGPDRMTSSGRYLAACLHRIMQSDETVAFEMSNWVRRFIPGAQSIDVRHMQDLHQYLLELHTVDGRTFSSRVISDGTLRILALLALQYDPDQSGVISLEEPENGIHPRRLSNVVSILRNMSTDLEDEHFDAEYVDKFRQVLINTHSPILVNELQPEDIIVVETSNQLQRDLNRFVRHTIYSPIIRPFNNKSIDIVREQIRELLEERDLGEIWTSGAIGGVP
ncbi:MAG: AAA family ATPase [Roseiflexaceae bacterium]